METCEQIQDVFCLEHFSSDVKIVADFALLLLSQNRKKKASSKGSLAGPTPASAFGS